MAVFALIILEVLGNFASKMLSFIKMVFSGAWDTLEAETQAVESAKTKSSSGKKFLEDSLKSFGKEIGKTEKAKDQHKKVPSGFVPGSLASMADNFLQGMAKIMKK